MVITHVSHYKVRINDRNKETRTNWNKMSGETSQDVNEADRWTKLSKIRFLNKYK